MHKIPVVSLKQTKNLSTCDTQNLVKELSQACEHPGVFYVTDFGIAPLIIEKMESAARKFFELPVEEKNKIHVSRSVHHRGYFPLLEESAKYSDVNDFKEGFDMALELNKDDPDVLAGVPLYGPNVWPDEPASFRKDIECYYSEVLNLGYFLINMLEQALQLPDRTIGQFLKKPMAQFRIIHYPPSDKDFKVSQGAGTHTDYSILTVLWQDRIGGLQVLSPSIGWLDVPPLENTLVCFVGDALERLVNGRWKATPHRVLSPRNVDRYSSAMFLDPDYFAVIEPLTAFVSSFDQPKYDPIVMGQYVQDNFDATFNYREKDIPDE